LNEKYCFAGLKLHFFEKKHWLELLRAIIF
jgi:hypothetical protein